MIPRRPEDPEPNSEQADEDQSQDVAADALAIGEGARDVTERRRDGDPTRLLPQDVPDLVEKMDEMVRSGRLDFDAFAGEPLHDDEEGTLGETDSDDED